MSGMDDYGDILHCSRPVSFKRNPMQRAHRAKQFAAFDALKGYEEAVRAQERLYEPYQELSPDKSEEIDRKLHRIHPHDRIRITWFQSRNDSDKEVGNYMTENGEVQMIDAQEHILLVNGRLILFDDITDLERDEFETKKVLKRR
ncbi:MAG: hypothetical protein LUI39_13130 [Lachnospiraceae bacterium]|nr:hypothetical protein [Lachnospiraceae bacterium]